MSPWSWKPSLTHLGLAVIPNIHSPANENASATVTVTSVSSWYFSTCSFCAKNPYCQSSRLLNFLPGALSGCQISHQVESTYFRLLLFLSVNHVFSFLRTFALWWSLVRVYFELCRSYSRR